MKHLIVFPLLLLTGCAAITRLSGAGAGAAGGALVGGPAGAAVGAIGGFLVAETVVPDAPSNGSPDTVWGLLSKIVDQAAWLAFVVAVLWLLTWVAPSPRELFRRMIARWRGTS